MSDAQNQSAPQPGTPEYDAAMAAKVDESAAKAAALANESGIPKEPAPVEHAVKEGQGKPDEQQAADASQEQAKEALSAKGLNFDEFSNEFAEKGELSEESFKKLEEAGIPKSFVDAYIEGQKALANQLRNDVFTSVGGEKQYQTMLEWAKTAYTPAEVEAFNKATLGSREEVMLAVSSLKSRFEAAYGRPPSLMGGAQQGGGAQGFSSTAEMTAAMRDPRYRSDPAYRAQVAAKLAVSDI